MSPERNKQIRSRAVPAIGLGTWELQGQTCRRTIELALELGYRHIDTARMYENEVDIGEAVSGSGVPRSELFITTKVPREELAPDALRRATEESLERLKMSYVDLLLIHWPNPSIPLLRTLTEMLQLRDAGLILEIGVSNFPSHLHEEASTLAPIFCNQVEFHPYLSQSELLSRVSKREQMLTAYSPLAQGQVFQDATLRRIGDNHGKSPGQVALRWLIDHSFVTAVPRSANPKHIEANFDVFDFELTDEERESIANLACGKRLIDPEWAPNWSGKVERVV